jgi:hypothetical protein
MTLLRAATASLALSVFALACSGDWQQTLRSGTYGPSFEYISPEQLKSVMWQMARDTHELEEILAQPESISEPDRARVRALLASVYDESGRLGSEGARTNHPMLDEDRDRFRADVKAASRGVDSQPPSYTLARTVTAACVHCHDHSVH